MSIGNWEIWANCQSATGNDGCSRALWRLGDSADRLVDLTNLVEDLGLYNVRGRLIRFLVGEADQGSPYSANSNLRHEDGAAYLGLWTQQEIAAYIGTMRGTFGRTPPALEDEGLAPLERERIVLLDRQELRRQV